MNVELDQTASGSGAFTYDIYVGSNRAGRITSSKCEFGAIFVLDKYRRQGVAKESIRKWTEIHLTYCDELTTTQVTSPATRKIFQQLGYERIEGTNDRYRLDPDNGSIEVDFQYHQIHQIATDLDSMQHIQFRNHYNTTEQRPHHPDVPIHVFDFHVRAPDDADTPRPERGPEALKSVLVVDDDAQTRELTLRFPSVELDQYGGRDPAEEIYTDITDRITPASARDWNPVAYIDRMDKTGVPHLKTDWLSKYEAIDTDDVLTFISDVTTAFNQEFFPVNN